MKKENKNELPSEFKRDLERAVVHTLKKDLEMAKKGGLPKAPEDKISQVASNFSQGSFQSATDAQVPIPPQPKKEPRVQFPAQPSVNPQPPVRISPKAKIQVEPKKQAQKIAKTPFRDHFEKSKPKFQAKTPSPFLQEPSEDDFRREENISQPKNKQTEFPIKKTAEVSAKEKTQKASLRSPAPAFRQKAPLPTKSSPADKYPSRRDEQNNSHIEVKKDGSLRVEEGHSFWRTFKKAFKIAFIVFILAVVSSVSYYFWVTQRSIESVLEPFIPQTFKADPISQPNKEILPNFSLNGANYLNMDFDHLDQEGVKKAISDKAQEVLQAKTTEPVEFVVTDVQNNPVSFGSFSRKMNIGSLDKLKEYFGSDFSLFMSNEAGNVKLCLVVSLKNNPGFEKEIVNVENDLPKDLGFLYLDYAYSFPNGGFSSSSYENFPIRYKNATSDKKLSLDYSIYGNYFVAGDSEITVRSVLDRMFGVSTEK